MTDLNWYDAIIKVLGESSEPLHYTAIAEVIAEQELRTSVGATPAATVASTISTSMRDEEDDSPFIRTGRGYYTVKSSKASPTGINELGESPIADETGLINALGMYWARNRILWTSTPSLLGQQQAGSTPVDFCAQRGVYLLHDGRAVVYVGRTTDQPLGVRLRQHTIDRLNSRWDRFSWFGVYPVAPNGSLQSSGIGTYDLDMLIVTMEALLIEGLEPPQNRKRGDEFKAVEFLQVEDPSIQRNQVLAAIDELKKKL